MFAASSGTRTFYMIEAVAERFEGIPRQLRRRRSDDFKARAVAESLEPGSSVPAITRRLDMVSQLPALFYLAGFDLRLSNAVTAFPTKSGTGA